MHLTIDANSCFVLAILARVSAHRSILNTLPRSRLSQIANGIVEGVPINVINEELRPFTEGVEPC